MDNGNRNLFLNFSISCVIFRTKVRKSMARKLTVAKEISAARNGLKKLVLHADNREEAEGGKMDVTSIAQMATGMAQTQTDQSVGILMLRKALDAETATATELLNAVPPVQNLPPHLGQNINTVA